MNNVIPTWVAEQLVCPKHKLPLIMRSMSRLSCPEGDDYPIVDGIPILLRNDVAANHKSFESTLQFLETGRGWFEELEATARSEPGIDKFVQYRQSSAAGKMYGGAHLRRYPIPDIRLPRRQGARLLDIGCNWGRWCVSAYRKGYLPVGIDPDIEAVRAAQRVFIQLGVEATAIVADARFLPFSSNSFDVVHSYSVLQHFSKHDVRSTLNEIAHVLKPGAQALIQLPNSWSVRPLCKKFFAGHKEPKQFDVRYWSPIEIYREFNRRIGPTTLRCHGFVTLSTELGDTDVIVPMFRTINVVSHYFGQLADFLILPKFIAESFFVYSVRQQPK